MMLGPALVFIVAIFLLANRRYALGGFALIVALLGMMAAC
jgi:hypothetical protein